jgi:hypothetical protein
MFNKILPFATVLILFSLVVTTSEIKAQATDASIQGTVEDPSGVPLPGATVRIVNEGTGFTSATATNTNGEFRFRQLPLGGPYSVNVSFVGFGSETRTGFQLSLGDQINLTFRLSDQVGELQEVVVTADAAQRISRLGTSTAMTGDEISRLPVPDRNFTNLAALSPQMGPGITIGGGRTMATNVTIDGVNARRSLTGGAISGGPSTISMEAIREFEINTNNYDVTQGRQGGGGISAVSKAGTNTFTGSLFGYHRNDGLRASQDFQGRDLAEFTTSQYGFALGGPIIRDRLHFFVAYDRQDEVIPRFINDLSTPQQEAQFRISAENFQRVISIVENQYGMPQMDHSGEFTRNTTANALFARLDFQINEDHTLTFRNNFTNWDNPLNGSGDRALSLMESIWNFNSTENSALLSLRSTFSDRFVNELKVQHQYGFREFELPIGKIPRAFVRVESELADGSLVNTEVQFGGHRWSPEVNTEHYIQVANTSYLEIGENQFTFGFDVMPMYMENWISNEQGGLFTFDSIEALENMEPTTYFRQEVLADDPFQRYWILDAGAFAQVELNLHRDVRATLGLRWDVTSFLTTPEYNPIVEQELGFRTDVSPTDFSGIQPRAQFTWDIGGNQRDIVRFGAGMFKSNPHYFIHFNNTLNTGLQVATINLDRAAGDFIPTPDFEAYRRDTNNNPGIADLGISPDDLPPPFIHSIRDDYKTPTTWKGNISYNRLISQDLRVGVNFLYSYTNNNYHYFDENLRDTPFFTTDPDNRPVWVPASTIDTGNGRTNMINSRKSELIDHAMVFNNDAKMRQRGFVIDAAYQIRRLGALLNASYTWNKTEDTSSYNCCQWTTALHNPVQVDPRQLEWAPADSDFRHKFVLSAMVPIIYGIELSGTYIGISGRGFSLLVSGDIDGTGSSNNDLAFIFDPDDPSTPANIAQGMRNAIENARPNVAKYLKENAGTRAERNAVRNEMQHTFNFRASKSFNFGNSQSIDITADIFNTLHFMNRDWGGQYNYGSNRRLLSVTGFDPVTEQFQYRVNESVGEVQKSGSVYQVQLGIRYNF